MQLAMFTFLKHGANILKLKCCPVYDELNAEYRVRAGTAALPCSGLQLKRAEHATRTQHRFYNKSSIYGKYMQGFEIIA